MKIASCIPMALPLLVAVGVATGEPLTNGLAPDVIEGTLSAAACVGDGDRTPACNQRAFAAGQPGGLLSGRRFTVLLVDGHILGRTCAAGVAGRLRASGLLHQNGFAMSLFRLEQDCGRGWTTVDVPHAGTLADGAAGGDE
jgi:hypothetical protein